jgi:hypothetical protein
MKWPCGDAGVPAPCNPWGGDVGDDLSLAISKSCSAHRDDDPKKLSLAQKATTRLAQVGSRRAILPDWFDTSVMVKITSEEA